LQKLPNQSSKQARWPAGPLVICVYDHRSKNDVLINDPLKEEPTYIWVVRREVAPPVHHSSNHMFNTLVSHKDGILFSGGDHSWHKTRILNPNILILNPYILNPKNLIMYSGCCFKYPNIFQRIQAYSLGTRIS
jgi:hypothetical protein